MLNDPRWALTPLRLRCLVLGHDDTLAREPNRLFLRCGACGRQTRGWTIGRAPGVPRPPAPFETATASGLPRIRATRPVF